MRKAPQFARRLALLLAISLALCACQGTNSAFQNPQPRSREAGVNPDLPPDDKTAGRKSVTGAGGEIDFGRAKLTVPVGSVTGDPIFIELSMPENPPVGVLPQTAVLISPQGVELAKDALLTILYSEGDIPMGRTEDEIVLVQNINGVWVDVPNSQIENHNNVVQTPIRYLGLYALQLPPLDQRNFNAVPTATFTVSDEPIKASFAPAIEPAVLETEGAVTEAPVQEEAVNNDLVEGPGADSVTLGPDADAGETPPPDASSSVEPQASAQFYEKRIVAGPEDEVAAEEIGPAGGAGNAAEAGAPDDSSVSSGSGVSEDINVPAPPARPEPEPEVTLSAEAQELYEAELEADDDLTYYFDASDSTDADGRVVQYDWDFNSDGIFDLSTSKGPYAKHKFEHNGNYTVVLKVTDNGRYRRSGFDTSIVPVRDLSAEPTQLSANISSFPPTGPVPLTVHFAASVIGGSPPYKYNWRFSDGSQSDIANPYTTYPEVSDHTVTFQVTDQRGQRLNGSLFVNACDCPPSSEARGHIALDISPNQDRGQAPLTSRFQLRAERATGPVVYRISFGDEGPGAPSTETTNGAVTHTYTHPGFYIMSVLATDADLRTQKSFATVHVTSSIEPRDFMLGKLEAGGDPYSFGHEMYIRADYTEASPRTVAFYAQKTPEPVENMSFQWDFGDNTYSTETTPRKTFAKDGTYEVRLTASDGGQLYRHRIWLPVSSKNPSASIQTTKVVEGAAPLRLDFSAIATRAQGPLSYDWQIGDARRSEANPFYEFTRPGEYPVSLTITDKYGDLIKTAPVTVRVHANTKDYRQPLVVVDRDSSGTGNRAVVLDYDAGSPLPLSSADVEGDISAVDISNNGEYVALVGADGLLVKQVANAQPSAVYLPAAGKVIATVALDNGGAYATVNSAEGVRTYLIQPGRSPLRIGPGRVLDSSRGGGNVLLTRADEAGALAEAALYRVDVKSGGISEPTSIGKIYDGRMTADGAELFFIAADTRIGIRDVATGHIDYINGASDGKSGLTISGDGETVAYVNNVGGKKSVVYGKRMSGSDFELTSLTGQTGFYSDDFELGSDGRFLLAYGSRAKLRQLLGEGRKVDAENAPTTAPRPERVGVIRLDLSGDPQSWDIGSVNPRFVTDSSRRFATAGSI